MKIVSKGLIFRLIRELRPRTGHGDPEGDQSYRSTISSTSALSRCGWLAPRRGRFTPGKENRYPFYKRLSGPQGRSL